MNNLFEYYHFVISYQQETTWTQLKENVATGIWTFKTHWADSDLRHPTRYTKRQVIPTLICAEKHRQCAVVFDEYDNSTWKILRQIFYPNEQKQNVTENTKIWLRWLSTINFYLFSIQNTKLHSRFLWQYDKIKWLFLLLWELSEYNCLPVVKLKYL